MTVYYPGASLNNVGQLLASMSQGLEPPAVFIVVHGEPPEGAIVLGRVTGLGAEEGTLEVGEA